MVKPIKPLGIMYLKITIIIITNQKLNHFILPLFYMKKNIPPEAGDFYLTPEGYRCFTAQYHLKRGYCCQSGCRHCPYGYDKKTNTFIKPNSKS